jgi:chromosome partitioning protein
MIDPGSANDQQYLKWLQANLDNRCFETTLPRANSLQDAARFHVPQRSFSAKYPGISSRSLRLIAEEVLARVAGNESDTSAAAVVANGQ